MDDTDMRHGVTDDEMEHYLMFPDTYCRCEGGCGPMCDQCIDDLNDEYATDTYDWEDDDGYA
jgi:hypothetical protein